MSSCVGTRGLGGPWQGSVAGPAEGGGGPGHGLGPPETHPRGEDLGAGRGVVERGESWQLGLQAGLAVWGLGLSCGCSGGLLCLERRACMRARIQVKSPRLFNLVQAEVLGPCEPCKCPGWPKCSLDTLQGHVLGEPGSQGLVESAEVHGFQAWGTAASPECCSGWESARWHEYRGCSRSHTARSQGSIAALRPCITPVKMLSRLRGCSWALKSASPRTCNAGQRSASIRASASAGLTCTTVCACNEVK